MTISELFNKFSILYKTEVQSKFNSSLESYNLLVNKAPQILTAWINTQNFKKNYLKVKGSIGQGNTTYYPWVAILDKRVSTGATSGFYVVILISDDFQDLFLTLNQGSTKQSSEIAEQNKIRVYRHKENLQGFSKGRIPERGLVKTREYNSANNGRKYEETNIFYRKYDISNIDEEDFYFHLEKLLDMYQNCAKNEVSPNNSFQKNFSFLEFENAIRKANLIFSNFLIKRYCALSLTKRFVLLTGLSGSGKTKLAQIFAHWICANISQYCLIPVGPDWTNREPLLGYPNALEPGKYIKPDNGVLDLLLNANSKSDLPFFLILDEMNLSHVERYFADFISAMESGVPMPLHSNKDSMLAQDGTLIPFEIPLPENLFIVGTVNIDETTYMFSPKVLDRAGVIEFKVADSEMKKFLDNPVKPDLNSLAEMGRTTAADFVSIATNRAPEYLEKETLQDVLMEFFAELKKVGAEFGYRTASEIYRFAGIVSMLTERDGAKWTFDQIADAAVMQKLLPKLHGSRRKLEPVLRVLAGLCLTDKNEAEKYLKNSENHDLNDRAKVRFPLSLEKIIRMYNRALQDGFTSFAEA